jgi:hypothetical protein
VPGWAWIGGTTDANFCIIRLQMSEHHTHEHAAPGHSMRCLVPCPSLAGSSRAGQLLISLHSSRSAMRSAGTRPSDTSIRAAAISSREMPLLSCGLGRTHAGRVYHGLTVQGRVLVLANCHWQQNMQWNGVGECKGMHHEWLSSQVGSISRAASRGARQLRKMVDFAFNHPASCMTPCSSREHGNST